MRASKNFDIQVPATRVYQTSPAVLSQHQNHQLSFRPILVHKAMRPSHVVVVILVLIPVFALAVYRLGTHLVIVFYHNVAMNKMMLETREVEEAEAAQAVNPPSNPQPAQPIQPAHAPANGPLANNGPPANAQPDNAAQANNQQPANGNANENGHGNPANGPPGNGQPPIRNPENGNGQGNGQGNGN
ncbi:HEAT repeat containing protein [Histoplasma capsulatum var. duboisii H88]|uniref:HEAT repeat containing protein n=2 Tax=Ajellomyces capsulatus (strain H88) TaxID=544711 RepID=A0A8A1LYX7_AJEC8|nr:HEAT repeat containing protein [Histoplasma capsulatum var. duboisii H88]